MGGSPRAPTSASGRGNQPAGGDLESNRGCPGARDIKRDGHIDKKTSAKTSTGPRSNFNQGPVLAGVTDITAPKGSVHVGVTVVAAPSGKSSRSGAVLAPLFPNALLAPSRDNIKVLKDIQCHSRSCRRWSSRPGGFHSLRFKPLHRHRRPGHPPMFNVVPLPTMSEKWVVTLCSPNEVVFNVRTLALASVSHRVPLQRPRTRNRWQA